MSRSVSTDTNASKWQKSGQEDQPPQYDSVSTSSLTNLNQIDTRPDSGKMLIMGQLDEPADVAVATNSNPAVAADVDINHVFKAYADVIDGSNTLTVTATDKSGNNNQTSTSYSFTVNSDTFTDPVYDADGNMLEDGTGRSYVWDQESRLKRINYPSGEYTTFTYNAFSQRIRKTEYNSSGTPTSDIAYIWCGGTQPCESRDFNSQATVLARYYPQGEQRIGGTDAGNYYYFKDHLASISEMVDSSENVRAQYEYDPYGRRSGNLVSTNPLEAQFGYTGHYNHSESGLILTWYRAYDPELGTWLSRDPIGENGGINLYGYVSNDPINYFDPNGLWQLTFRAAYAAGLEISIGNNGGGWNIFGGQWNVGAKLLGGVGAEIDLELGDEGRQESGLECEAFAEAAVKPGGKVSIGADISDRDGIAGAIEAGIPGPYVRGEVRTADPSSPNPSDINADADVGLSVGAGAGAYLGGGARLHF